MRRIPGSLKWEEETFQGGKMTWARKQKRESTREARAQGLCTWEREREWEVGKIHFCQLQVICGRLNMHSYLHSFWNLRKRQSRNKNDTNPQKRRIKNINRSLKNCRVDRSMVVNLNFSFIFLLSAREEWGTVRNQVICAAGLQKAWGTGCTRGLWRLRGVEESCWMRLKRRPVGSLQAHMRSEVCLTKNRGGKWNLT